MVSCERGGTCPDGGAAVRGERLVCTGSESERACRWEEFEECPCNEAVERCLVAPRCGDGLSGVREWQEQEPTGRTHVVDGAFTAGEWAGTTRLEGLFTDVYLDYADGQLFLLNDWRRNDEGIRPECFNYFRVVVGGDTLDLRVYGDGRVTVDRNGVPDAAAAQGAYGFNASPQNSAPHTIYEFSLAVPPVPMNVCCFDPVSMAECDVLAEEPIVVSVEPTASGVNVGRAIPAGSVERLGLDAPCGDGEGICDGDLSCEWVEGGDRRCTAPPPPTPEPPPEPPPELPGMPD